jgi:hypothetical protein
VRNEHRLLSVTATGIFVLDTGGPGVLTKLLVSPRIASGSPDVPIKAAGC